MGDETIPDPWDETLARIERRGKRLFAMVASLALALIATVLTILAGWGQIKEAQEHLRVKVIDVASEVDRVDDHVSVNDQRLDAVGAPPPVQP